MRENGFYWVFTSYDSWIIAEWNNGWIGEYLGTLKKGWRYGDGLDDIYDDFEFKKIDERIIINPNK